MFVGERGLSLLAKDHCTLGKRLIYLRWLTKSRPELCLNGLVC
jgi:hypothetical protein